jgi:hypothetical protein
VGVVLLNHCGAHLVSGHVLLWLLRVVAVLLLLLM